MTTPRIEEIKAEFQMFVPDDDGSAMDWLENTLAEAHQAGRDEAVEYLRETFKEDSEIGVNHLLVELEALQDK